MDAWLEKNNDDVGSGSINLRFHFGHRRPTMSVGKLNEFDSIEEIVEAVREKVRLARKGINPIEERKREKAANLAAERAKKPVTFRQKAEAVRDVYTPTLKHKYAAGNWFNPINRHVFPIIGDLPINDVEPRHIAAVLTALDAAGIPKTGPRLRAHIAMIFDAAIANGDRDPLRGNPADARLMRAMRPGTSKSDDEHYPRVDLVDAPQRVCALQDAKGAAQNLWQHLSRCVAAHDRDRPAPW